MTVVYICIIFDFLRQIVAFCSHGTTVHTKSDCMLVVIILILTKPVRCRVCIYEFCFILFRVNNY